MFEFCIIGIYLLINYAISRFMWDAAWRDIHEDDKLKFLVVSMFLFLGLFLLLTVMPFALFDKIKVNIQEYKEQKRRVQREVEEARDRRRRESYTDAMNQAGGGIYPGGMVMYAAQQAQIAYNQLAEQQNQLSAIQQQSANQTRQMAAATEQALYYGSQSINVQSGDVQSVMPDSFRSQMLGTWYESSPALKCNEKEEYTGFGSWYKDSLKKK